MPDPALITTCPTAVDHLNQLPPVLRDDPSYQAVIYSLAKECERVESFIEEVRAQFQPRTADVLLKMWEVMTGLTPDPVGQTLDQRRATVEALLGKMVADPSGLAWEAQITKLVGPGWTYQEHIEGDPSTPPANTVRIQLPYPPTGAAYALARKLIRDITPANTDIILEYAGGFELDESQLDEEGLA